MGLARRLRGRSTGAEETLWGCLRNRRMSGAKFRRQHPLGRYIADFYCHEARLVIELEGPIHEKDDQKGYDRVRKDIIRQQGIRLLRFTNEEITSDLNTVLSRIFEALAT
ncbi:MAG: endonuclease domain-containing protein, partial [Chloroflexi bacterium]|nr:endonuclease domain-containing protein [Chloroflexota bacterium]